MDMISAKNRVELRGERWNKGRLVSGQVHERIATIFRVPVPTRDTFYSTTSSTAVIAGHGIDIPRVKCAAVCT